MHDQENKQIQSNRETTRKWGAGIIITILLQTLMFVWWSATTVADLKSATQRNAEDIAILQSNMPALTRQNVEDLLLVRDTRIDSIQSTVGRLEQKIDRAFGYTK